MAHQLANLYGISEASIVPKAPIPWNKPHCRRTGRLIMCCSSNELPFEASEQRSAFHATRRVVMNQLFVSSAALLGLFQGKATSLAEDQGNRLWVDGVLPVPPVYSKIANEETGTRSFLKNGVYIADLGTKQRIYRLRKYAFDLMALGDLIGQDSWPYITRYLRLKSTFMYYDFDKVISAAEVSNRQPLTDLANRLFDNFEKLLEAVKLHDLPKTQSSYRDTTVVLQEVMDRMA